MKNKYQKIFVFGMLFISFFGALAQDSKNDTPTKPNNSIEKLSPEQNVDFANPKQFLRDKLSQSRNVDFVFKSEKVDQLGMVHREYQQTYNGIPVQFAISTLHGKNGTAQILSGTRYEIDQNSTAGLSAVTAFNKAKAHVGASRYMWDDEQTAAQLNYAKPLGELVYLPVVEEGITLARLAYKFDIYASEPISRGDVYIDAATGNLLMYNPIIKHADNFGHVGSDIAKVQTWEEYCESLEAETNFIAVGPADTRYSGNQNIETSLLSGSHVLRDNTRGNGINTYNSGGQNSYPIVDFEDNDNNWTAAEYDNALKDNAALDAHWGAEMTYDYFLSVHNRNSFDDNGATIDSWVHYDNQPGGLGYDNAFWNGSNMTYGDGTSNGQEGNGSFDALTSLDVAAHEIGHAVTSSTANMVYRREPGALNEGFSDIWGAAVEHFAKGNGSDTNPSPEIWLLGDEIDRRVGSVALRSISNPNEKGQPDTYGGNFWRDPECANPSIFNDYCGVHINSGVLNFWFYLSVVGGNGTNDNGDAYNVNSIGMTKATAIAYRALVFYLNSSSKFIDARNAIIQSAQDLYGADSQEEQTVTNAWYAVGVGDPYAGGGGDTEAPTVPVNLFADNTTQDSTDLSWDASNDNVGVTGYEVFRDGNSIGTTGTTDFNATGLSAGTTYTFTVRAFDAAGNNSAQSGGLDVTTLPGTGGSDDCSGTVSTYPDSESFESGFGNWSQSALDDGDWLRNSGGTPSGNTGPGSASDGSTYIYVEASSNGTAGEIGTDARAILNSPCYDLSGEASASLAFDYHMYGSADMGSLDLEVSTDDGATWTSIWNQSGNQGDQWNSESIDLNAYAGENNFRMRFNRLTGGTWQADLAIDNLNMTTTGGGGGGCTGGVTAGYTEGFESSIGTWTQASGDDLDWTRDSGGTPSSNTGPSSGSGSTWYMYVEATGNGTGYPNKQAILNSPCIDLTGETGADFTFDYHMYGSTDMGSIALEASTDGSTWTSLWSQTGNQGNQWNAQSVSLDTYAGGTVQLRFNRVTGSTWQADVAVDNVALASGGGGGNPPTGYCASNGNNTSDEYIQRVQIGSIDNSTGASAGGYGDYTNQSTNLSASNSITITPLWTGTVYNEGYAVFVDWNRDGDFGDADELAFFQTATAATPINGSFSVPGGASAGPTRMRVSMKYNDVPDPCESFAWGEVEDYIVVIPAAVQGTPDVNSITGANTLESSILELDIWPNPVSRGVLNAKIANVNATEYAIYNLAGQMVAKGTFANTIDVSQLQSGMYMLQVTVDGQKLVENFIVE